MENEVNFPTQIEMTSFLLQQRISVLLGLIRSKMVAVISADTFIVLNLDELRLFTPEIIAKVKSILCNKGYTLIEREDVTGNSCGFKISWAPATAIVPHVNINIPR